MRRSNCLCFVVGCVVGGGGCGRVGCGRGRGGGGGCGCWVVGGVGIVGCYYD